MQEQKEVWLPVKGYEGLYEVSNLGQIKSLKFGKEKILKPNIDSKGYKRINLCVNGVCKINKVHQIVAISFLNHIPCGHKIVVDHINNKDKQNNSVSNLQLISNRENTVKDIKNGTSNYTGVYWDKSNNKWMARIYFNGKYKYLGRFICEKEASESYKKALKNIS